MIKSAFDFLVVNRVGYLEQDQAEQVVLRIMSRLGQLEVDAPVRHDALAEKHLHVLQSWDRFAEDIDDDIDFKNFLTWFSSIGFMEGLLIDSDESKLRRLARDSGVDMNFVDKVKAWFDACDADGNGEVDFDEFAQIFPKALQVPEGQKVPEARVRYFWSQVDEDCNGLVDFEEFLAFWIMYFYEVESQNADAKKSPFEDIYKSVRRMDQKYLDPPWKVTDVIANIAKNLDLS